ncbi:MAG: cytochrome b/b6 domain-containing protein [Myxococcales bacterium]|nr:cytochrome b/b6 domain-containing protein [Myxococcales bacterium]
MGSAISTKPASRPLHPWPIRLTHWANAALLVVMAGSGLQIFVAYPALGPVADLAWWYPLQWKEPPHALTLGGWLAGARHWHFAFAWAFFLNGLAYALYLAASGEWRERLFFPRRDLRHAVATFLYYLRLARRPAPIGLYNGLQRLAYTSVLLIAPLEVLAGLALFKPVQLPRLTALLGGYEGARAIHLLVLAGLALFTTIHVVQVALHPRTFLAMTLGRTTLRGAPRG